LRGRKRDRNNKGKKEKDVSAQVEPDLRGENRRVYVKDGQGGKRDFNGIPCNVEPQKGKETG